MTRIPRLCRALGAAPVARIRPGGRVPTPRGGPCRAAPAAPAAADRAPRAPGRLAGGRVGRQSHQHLPRRGFDWKAKQGQAGFQEYLDASTFQAWDDIAPPRIRISADGQMAFVVVQKRVHLTTQGPGGGAEAERTRFAWLSVHESRGASGGSRPSRLLSARIRCSGRSGSGMAVPLSKGFFEGVGSPAPVVYREPVRESSWWSAATGATGMDTAGGRSTATAWLPCTTTAAATIIASSGTQESALWSSTNAGAGTIAAMRTGSGIATNATTARTMRTTEHSPAAGTPLARFALA